MESSPSLDTSGEGVIQGLYELWLHTLRDVVLDNGNASFSRYHLVWGNTPSMRVDISVVPFNNFSLLKLRQWTNFMSNKQEGEDGFIAQHHEQERISILHRLAQLHYELLLVSNRWEALAIDWSAEARELLVRFESMTDPKEL